MRRNLVRPRDPDALGLALLALRRHASGRSGGEQFDRETGAALADLGVSREVARRMVARVDRLRPSVRARVFGRFGEPGAASPRDRVVRDPVLPPVVAVPSSLLDSVRGEVIDGPEIVLGENGVPQTAVHTLRYRGVHCEAETGDRTNVTGFGNSDEIYVVTSTVSIGTDPPAENDVRTERHPVSDSQTTYGDVDQYETRIGPVAACWSGTLRPRSGDVVSLSAAVFEHDEGDPDHYREEVDTAVKLGLAVASYLCPKCAPIFIAAGLQGSLTDLITSLLGSGDDVVTTETVVLDLPRLEWYSSRRLRTHTDTRPVLVGGGFPPKVEMRPFDTNLLHHFVTDHRGLGARYVVGFDVTRQPPFDLDLTDPQVVD